jgi:hypothetical protein
VFNLKQQSPEHLGGRRGSLSLIATLDIITILAYGLKVVRDSIEKPSYTNAKTEVYNLRVKYKMTV